MSIYLLNDKTRIDLTINYCDDKGAKDRRVTLILGNADDLEAADQVIISESDFIDLIKDLLYKGA